MKVNKLIKQLQKIERINPEQEIYIADEEGSDEIFDDWKLFIDLDGNVVLEDSIIGRESALLQLLTKKNLEKLKI
jgi:hypothetical protein